jgi:hypothetical protein
MFRIIKAAKPPRENEMQNGLYLAQFVVNGSAGHGVAVIREGKVVGGDSSYWWEGSLEDSGDTFSGDLNVKQHSSGMESVFGFFESFSLSLNGKRNGDAWQAEGTTPVAPGRTMQLNLRLLKAD